MGHRTRQVIDWQTEQRYCHGCVMDITGHTCRKTFEGAATGTNML